MHPEFIRFIEKDQHDLKMKFLSQNEIFIFFTPKNVFSDVSEEQISKADMEFCCIPKDGSLDANLYSEFESTAKVIGPGAFPTDIQAPEEGVYWYFRLKIARGMKSAGDDKIKQKIISIFKKYNIEVHDHTNDFDRHWALMRPW